MSLRKWARNKSLRNLVPSGFGSPRYEVPRVCEDAVEFFKRTEELDERVAKHLDEKHWTRCELGRKVNLIYPVGSKVWYKRPACLSTGLHSVWEGPCEVLRRVGAGSYLISV